MVTDKDKKYMSRALELASRGAGNTSPNPMVGAVIVKGNRTIAEDYHRSPGTPHAEPLALKKAGEQAIGGTLYVSLEPCCHTDKRTPPCTKTIIRSGVKRVVVAMKDPNPKVSGKGIRELRRAGIETDIGVMKNESKKLNEAFIKYITLKEPFVTLKIAQTLDGKIATFKGNSKWITGPEARKYVHRLRHENDALMVGIGTVLADNPSLDCRIARKRNPYRVIVDSSLQIPLRSKLLMHDDNKTIIATTQKSDPRKIRRLISMGAQVKIIREKNGRVSLKSLMKELANMEIMSLMIEGGSSLNASVLSCRIVDKVLTFMAPGILGGVNSIPSVGGSSPALIKSMIRLKGTVLRHFGNDLLIEGYPEY